VTKGVFEGLDTSRVTLAPAVPAALMGTIGCAGAGAGSGGSACAGAGAGAGAGTGATADA
jgi:macrolide transport system ATP-binding/permease protein